MEQPLPEGAPEQCSVEGSNIEAKDHTIFLVFMMCITAVASPAYTFGLKADYRRRRANLDIKNKGYYRISRIVGGKGSVFSRIVLRHGISRDG